MLLIGSILIPQTFLYKCASNWYFLPNSNINLKSEYKFQYYRPPCQLWTSKKIKYLDFKVINKLVLQNMLFIIRYYLIQRKYFISWSKFWSFRSALDRKKSNIKYLKFKLVIQNMLLMVSSYLIQILRVTPKLVFANYAFICSSCLVPRKTWIQFSNSDSKGMLWTGRKKNK